MNQTIYIVTFKSEQDINERYCLIKKSSYFIPLGFYGVP
ncbi:unnamed protein product [Spirodela intermedia]|uniref:Uncharacterized protein n=2 Tax=Spirodela intermedia TaxID=51605 RepID=A0A7I8IIJ9_SPIIN|nr:unnamed protein product [Spirodela intermedia]CAA6657706.1 unnamed protein product [Spirodela intermedia]CAA7393814.1 unnamed protein product [Spirodela intermedia]